jgi:hypothetical protein
MTFAGMCGTLAVGPILANYGNQVGQFTHL